MLAQVGPGHGSTSCRMEDEESTAEGVHKNDTVIRIPTHIVTFHPNREEYTCSDDGISERRYTAIKMSDRSTSTLERISEQVPTAL